MSVRIVDLFCGAGGSSTGALRAVNAIGLSAEMLAVNHWDVAIATHTANHPGAAHLCQDIENVKPRVAVPGGRVELLWASPSCTHHSNARGGRPRAEQSRASAWDILRWCEDLYIETVIIENVEEFRSWGPLDEHGLPVGKLRGQLYRRFLSCLRALGYTVSERVLNAADYGDATTRRRLFVQARRGKPIAWPEPTHTAAHKPQTSLRLSGESRQWRTARDIIDWSIEGASIYGRAKPLAENTMRRILAGLRKFSGLPFICGCGGPSGQAEPRSVDEPLGTILAQDHRVLCQPYLIVRRSSQDACSPAAPASRFGAQRGPDCEDLGIAAPYIVRYNGSHARRDDGDLRAQDVDSPLSTLDTSNRLALAAPYLIKYYGTDGDAHSLDEPLPTLTARDRFALVSPTMVASIASDVIGWLDIRFRMLQPHEMAAAMGFPADYVVTGNREQRVRQIGNAVCVNLSEAICRAVLAGRKDA